MPMTLSLDECGAGIGTAWTVLREHAARAGLDAEVPTCPGWRVRDLVAHQGMVHRSASGRLRGDDTQDTDAMEQEGRASGDILRWLDEGVTALLSALAFAPDDLDVSFFLKDAPAPKLAWARRQCHETTMHAVDAMSASLGRTPAARETWVDAALAVDGVDELLCGFVPRRRERIRSASPRTVVVEASDTGHSWTLRTSKDPVVTTAHAPGDRVARPEGAALVRGTAAQLYLGLWNRGEEIESTEPDLLTHWRSHLVVTW